MGVLTRNVKITSFDEFRYFKNVQIVAGDTFQGCTELKSVVFPENVQQIANGADANTINQNSRVGCFAYCSNLKNVILNEGLKQIGKNNFRLCGIESINIPSSVEMIDTYCFRASSLSGELVLPEGITVYSFLFYDTNLEKITFKGDAYFGLGHIIPKLLKVLHVNGTMSGSLNTALASFDLEELVSGPIEVTDVKTFQYAKKLSKFECPSLPLLSINFASPVLTAESVLNILNALQENTTGGALTLTLNATSKATYNNSALATANGTAEAIVAAKGWTLA